MFVAIGARRALLPLVLSLAAVAVGQDAIYYPAGPPASPTAGTYAGDEQGRIVRLDASTGLYDTVSGVVQLGGMAPSGPHSGPYIAVYRDTDALYVYDAPDAGDANARLLRITPEAREFEVLFEGVPPVADAFWRPDMLRTGPTEFVLISRNEGSVRRNFGILDYAADTFTILQGDATSAVSVDVDARTYLTISSDLTKIERVAWDTGSRTTIRTVDPTAITNAGVGPPVIDFSPYQNLVYFLRAKVSSSSNNSRSFLIDFSSGSQVIVVGTPRINTPSYVVRVFDPYITLHDGLNNYNLDTTITQSGPKGLRQGRYSIPNLGIYYPPTEVVAVSTTSFYDYFRGRVYSSDYNEISMDDFRLDFPPLTPPVVRGTGPALPVFLLGSQHQLLPGPSEGTLSLLTSNQLWYIHIPSGDRILVTELPADVQYPGGATKTVNPPLQGRQARPPAPVEYIDHLINIVPFTPQTVAPDRNLDGDVNSGDLVRRQNEVEVLP